jgi:anaerobic selenocysteine-containing dehydrogenase
MAITASTCPLDCPDACGVLVEADERGRFAGLRGNPAHGYSRGTLCGKTALYGELVTSTDRLRAPLVREGGELRPATWDAAVARIAERVEPLQGERILAASYAGSMGFVARRFPERVIHALGGALTDGGLCDNSATLGYEVVYGRVIGADVESIEDADLAVLWGTDVKRTVQHLQPFVQRLAKRGVPVVAIDIYRTDTIRALEAWGGSRCRGFVLRPGTDAMLALALARLAYERGHADRAFLGRECHGAEAFERHVRSGHDLATAASVTGLAPGEIEELAALLFASRRPFLKTGVGFARRRNGGMSMRAVLSLAAVLGRAEGVHYESSDCFGLRQDVVEGADLRPRGSEDRRIRHVELGRELESGRWEALFVWGHNPAVTCPDAGRVARALERRDLFVVVHEQFLTETAARADVVLPATTFVEHADVYRSYGHRYVHYARAACRPPDGPPGLEREGPRSNVRAFAAIARALGLPPRTWEVTEEGLCEELLAASAGRLGPDGLARLRAGEPVKVVPLPGRGTPSGRIELESSRAAAAGQPALASYVPDDGCGTPGAYWLIPAPSVHTHNSTFAHSARHQKRAGPPRVYMNPSDAAAEGLAAGERVTLSNPRGALTMRLELNGDLPRGSLRVDGLLRAAEIPEGLGLNALVSDAVSDLGESNTLYSTRVDVRRARA